jgi:hypothetical protein
MASRASHTIAIFERLVIVSIDSLCLSRVA